MPIYKKLISKMTKHKLKQKAKKLEPHIRIGKKGLTEEVVKEIANQLKDKEIIKIKLLKPAIKDKKHKKAMAIELAGKTGSMLIDRVGSVIVLHKAKNKGGK